MPRQWRRWSEADAQRVLAEQASSGLSLLEFARREGLHPERLRRWRSRLESPPPAAAGVRLVELLARASSQAEPPRLLLHCPTGHTVEVVGTDLVEGLRAVLTATASTPC
mgnify:CR=1 FL=1